MHELGDAASLFDHLAGRCRERSDAAPKLRFPQAKDNQPCESRYDPKRPIAFPAFVQVHPDSEHFGHH